MARTSSPSSRKEWPFIYEVFDRVEKVSGDYKYRGTIVARFRKLTGAVRYVVENEDGMLMIMNSTQLIPWSE